MHAGTDTTLYGGFFVPYTPQYDSPHTQGFSINNIGTLHGGANFTIGNAANIEAARAVDSNTPELASGAAYIFTVWIDYGIPTGFKFQ
jgi:hypothetical protein